MDAILYFLAVASTTAIIHVLHFMHILPEKAIHHNLLFRFTHMFTCAHTFHQIVTTTVCVCVKKVLHHTFPFVVSCFGVRKSFRFCTHHPMPYLWTVATKWVSHTEVKVYVISGAWHVWCKHVFIIRSRNVRSVPI